VGVKGLHKHNCLRHMSRERHSIRPNIQSLGFGTTPCLPVTGIRMLDPNLTQSQTWPKDQFEKSITYFWVQVFKRYTSSQWMSRYIWYTTVRGSIPASFANYS